MLWTRERFPNRHVAFRDDEWGGATLTLEGVPGRRIIGVADHAAHLEAIVVAGVALVAAQGQYPTGYRMASEAGQQLMDKLIYLELDLAVWRSSSGDPTQ